MNSNRTTQLTALLLTLLMLSGCIAHVGPRSIGPSRENYSEAIRVSWDEQALLNLVRLRYRDSPVFLDVGTVVTHFVHTSGLGANASVGDGSDWGVGASGSWLFSEEPTVTFTPLTGEAFVKRLLAPMSPTTIALLSQSGWSFQRLLLCCVQEINGVPNARAASGPTPDYVPTYLEFREVARLLRELQREELIRLRSSDTEGGLVIEFLDATKTGPARERLAELLEVDDSLLELKIRAGVGRGDVESLLVTPRSLLGTMYFLSHAVDVPAEHVAAGLVTVTRDENGEVFDWGQVTDDLIRIQFSKEMPANAAVRVRYRGHWFYIADNDLTSKSTFNLLTGLFSLASDRTGREPLLTVNVP